jgi:hypothetical protein
VPVAVPPVGVLAREERAQVILRFSDADSLEVDHKAWLAVAPHLVVPVQIQDQQ